MRSGISLQPIPILIDGHDTEGSLVLHEGQLVAVLARLDGQSHDEAMQGWWHLEAGFGPCEERGTQLFESLEHAAIWARHRVGAGSKLRLVSKQPGGAVS
jgi:hypothetical protein